MPAILLPADLVLPQGKVLEGIVTTRNQDGSTNISPMGPIVNNDVSRLRLRPFSSSTTYRNLCCSRVGVLHVTDDVELLAQAAIGMIKPWPNMIPAQAVEGNIIENACRWYAFRVEEIDDSAERIEIMAQVVDQGKLHDWFGFNRAKHAVIEAAILATRCDILPAKEILVEFKRLETPIQKTGGTQEHKAFRLLESFVAEQLLEM